MEIERETTVLITLFIFMFYTHTLTSQRWGLERGDTSGAEFWLVVIQFILFKYETKARKAIEVTTWQQSALCFIIAVTAVDLLLLFRDTVRSCTHIRSFSHWTEQQQSQLLITALQGSSSMESLLVVLWNSRVTIGLMKGKGVSLNCEEWALCSMCGAKSSEREVNTSVNVWMHWGMTKTVCEKEHELKKITFHIVAYS